MRLRPLLLLLLVLLLAVLARVVWPSGDPAPDAPDTPTAQAEAEGPRPQGVQDPGQASRSTLKPDGASTLSRPSDSRFGLTGRVHWLDGKPAPDLSVVLVDGENGTQVAETRSDAQGRYSLFLPQGERTRRPPTDTYDVHCPGYTLAHPTDAFGRPDDPPTPVDLALLPGRPLQVQARHHRDATPAPFVTIAATCDLDYEHELFTFTDAEGKGLLHLPHEGPWDFRAYAGQLHGFTLGFPTTPWLEPKVEAVVVEVVSPPTGMHLQAVDLRTGGAIEHARFRRAEVPEDARHLPEAGRARMPDALPFEHGRLRAEFDGPGRAFVKIEAEGYLPEVVEWVEDDGRVYEVGLIPLLAAPIEVMRRGKPVATEVTIAFNRRSLLLHADESIRDLAASPQVGTLHSFRSDALGRCDLMLPDQEAEGAPMFFDLWIEDGEQRRFFGSLAASRLGPAPWRFELEPPTGTLVLSVVDADGNGVPAVPYQISTTLAPSIRDSADEARGGLRSQILSSDLEGRIEVDLPAPSHVVAVGSGTLTAARVHAEGDLRAGETLHLQAVIDPQERAMRPHPITRGRIVVDGGEDYARDQRLMTVRATPLDDRALAAELPTWLTRVEATREGAFQFQLPEGSYALSLETEDFELARAGGRWVECDSGDQEVELHVPPPAGLRIHTTDLSDGSPLAADDVFLRVDGRYLTHLETWEEGDAAHLCLFAPRVEYVVEREGRVPILGSVDLAPGRTTELYLGLDRGRRLDFRLQAPDGSLLTHPALHLKWMDPPGVEHPYDIPVLDSAWEAAPMTSVRIAAYLDELFLGEVLVPQGVATEQVILPLTADPDADQ